MNATESNLVKMGTAHSSMEEVNNNNNNNNNNSSCSGGMIKKPSFNGLVPATVGSNSPEADEDLESTSSISSSSKSLVEDQLKPPSSIYGQNDTFRLTVSSPEEWLCVARMPLDLNQIEFHNLLQDYGAVQQCFLIHSETSGM
jgi:hypothetical protein